MKPQVFIYALVKKQTGKAVYAGQTYHPLRRHQKLKSELGLCILRVTNRENALRIESQVIRAYKKRGECDLNRNTGTSSRIKVRSKRKVRLWIRGKGKGFWKVDKILADQPMKNPIAVAGGKARSERKTLSSRANARGYWDRVRAGVIPAPRLPGRAKKRKVMRVSPNVCSAEATFVK